MGILPRAIYLDAAKRVTARLEEIDARMAEGRQDGRRSGAPGCG